MTNGRGAIQDLEGQTVTGPTPEDNGRPKPASPTTDRAETHASTKKPHGSNRALILRFLRDWIWPRKGPLTGVLIAMACLAGATSGYPLIIKYSFDSLNAGNASILPLVLIGVVAIAFARASTLYLSTVLANTFVISITTEIQKAGFRKLVRADFARLTREAPGQLVSRLTHEVAFIETGMMAALNSAIRDPLMIVWLVAMMFYLDWVMSLIVLCVYPIAAWPIVAITKALRRVAKQTQESLGEMTSLLMEKLSAARLIKTFRLEHYALVRTTARFHDIRDLRKKAIRRRARIEPMLELLGGVAVAGVIGLAYWRISTGQSTVGDFMGFVAALLMAAQPIRGLGSLPGRLQEGLSAAERFYAVMDEPEQITDTPNAGPLKTSNGDIAFDDISFAYAGAERIAAVEHFSLNVKGGTTVALVGRSGAGKSTLINLVPRLFDVTGGRILIDGQDIRSVKLDSLRDAISIVSQDVTLFDDTIRANIALGRLGAAEDDIVAAAKAAAAHDFILQQPDGYNTLVGSSGARLSGGQRQRIALARAILKDAPILLLDEATSALDAESERIVQNALREFAHQRTTLVIAHRLSTVQDADLICVMDNGQLAELGTHAELIAKHGIYAELCRSQFLPNTEREPNKTGI